MIAAVVDISPRTGSWGLVMVPSGSEMLRATFQIICCELKNVAHMTQVHENVVLISNIRNIIFFIHRDSRKDIIPLSRFHEPCVELNAVASQSLIASVFI